jgi:hypothetical protein
VHAKRATHPSLRMLSILRIQAKQLEKELLETRQQVQPLQRTVKDHEATITAKDAKIAELEAELLKRRPLDDLILCRACGRSTDEEPEPDSEPEPPLITEDVLQKLDELTKRLRKAESKLTSAELAKQLAELQLLTHTSKLRRGFERDLEGAQAAAKAAIAKAAKEVDVAKAAQRVAENASAARDVEISELKAGLKRRDEQIEFLMQVHDASQSCEWVDTAAASTANDAEMAASLAAAMRLSEAGGPSAANTANDAEMAASLAAAMRLSDGPPAQGSPASVALAARRNANNNTGPWQCGVCTLKNESARTLCEACGSERS